MRDDLVPAVLLAQGGGHDHVLTVSVSIGPLVLRVALLAAIPVVAGFALLRGFLPEPDRRALAAVIGCAGGAVVLELLLSGGLNLSQRLVPVLLLLLSVPLYLVLSRDPRFARAVRAGRLVAPWVFWAAGVLAGWQLVVAWGRGDTVALHTGVVYALVALAWFFVAAPSGVVGRVGARVGAAVLASALIAGAGQATVLRPEEPSQAQVGP